MCIGFALSGGVLVDQLAKPAHGVDGFVVLAELVHAAGSIFGFWILTFRQSEFVGQTKLHLYGWRETAWIAFLVSFGCALPVGVAGILALLLKEFAKVSRAGLAVQVRAPGRGGPLFGCFLVMHRLHFPFSAGRPAGGGTAG